MQFVVYTQRVEVISAYGERRDCVDQRIVDWIVACGYLPVALPNHAEIALSLVKRLKPVGVILTGGNSLVKYGGDAKERDEMERELLSYAIRENIPVYGFCRGMQMILDYFDCALKDIEGHVAVRHVITGLIKEEVNSFHQQGCLEVKEPLVVLAKTSDGVIEAVKCNQPRLLATMWHPERETPFKEQDMIRIQNLFGKED